MIDQKLLARLPKRYAPPIIIFIVFHSIYMNDYPTLINLPDKISESFSPIFSMFPLILYLLIMTVAVFILILNLVSDFFKNNDSDE